MGVPLATVMFVGLTPLLEAKLQVPMVIYQGLQIVAGSVLITPFRKWVEQTRALVENQEINV
jgi:solute carrier family 10 (sodium/bile acid cotransporter), member 7